MSKMEKTIFFTYSRLYPGKEDIIIETIRKAECEGTRMGLTEKELQDYIESEVLDAIDD